MNRVQTFAAGIDRRNNIVISQPADDVGIGIACGRCACERCVRSATGSRPLDVVIGCAGRRRPGQHHLPAIGGGRQAGGGGRRPGRRRGQVCAGRHADQVVIVFGDIHRAVRGEEHTVGQPRLDIAAGIRDRDRAVVPAGIAVAIAGCAVGAPEIRMDTIEVGDAAGGIHHFDPIVAVISDNQHVVGRLGQTHRLVEHGRGFGDRKIGGVLPDVVVVARAVEAGVGGDDAAGTDEVDAVAAGVADGDHAVFHDDDALEGGTGVGHSGDNATVGGAGGDLEKDVARGHIKIGRAIQGHRVGIGQTPRNAGERFAVRVECDHGAVFAVATIEDINVIISIQGHACQTECSRG